MPIAANRSWWDRTFLERQRATDEAFGRSQPQGSPAGYVVSLKLSWPAEAPNLVIPGACIQVFPPNPPAMEATAPQADWLYLTSGLSQPLKRGEPWRGVGTVRTDLGDRLSGYGAEFGLLLPEPQAWAVGFLRWLMLYVSTQAVVGYGHRVLFGFHGAEERRSYFVGPAEEFGVTPLDRTAGMAFLPLTTGPASIVTSTGWFGLMIATSATADELAFARRTTTGHLILLLTRAGVGQRTVFGRPSVFDDPQWSDAAVEIEAMSHEAVDQALRDLRRARAHSAATPVNGGTGSAE